MLWAWVGWVGGWVGGWVTLSKYSVSHSVLRRVAMEVSASSFSFSVTALASWAVSSSMRASYWGLRWVGVWVGGLNGWVGGLVSLAYLGLALGAGGAKEEDGGLDAVRLETVHRFLCWFGLRGVSEWVGWVGGWVERLCMDVPRTRT